MTAPKPKSQIEALSDLYVATGVEAWVSKSTMFRARDRDFATLAHNMMSDLLEAHHELSRFVEYLAVASNDDGAYAHELNRARKLLNRLEHNLPEDQLDLDPEPDTPTPGQ